MDLVLSEEQELLRSSANHYLRDHAARLRLRELYDSSEGWSPHDWQHIAKELGWVGAAVPTQYGGLGLGVPELVVLQQELGRALYPSPFFAVAGLALPALLELGSEAQLHSLLPPVVSGDCILSLAFTDRLGRPLPEGIEVRAEVNGDGVSLSGEAGFVLFGHAAHLLLVVAHEADGLSLFAVRSDTPGLTMRRLRSADPARQLAALTLTAIKLPGTSRIGAPGQAGDALTRVMQRAAIIQAGEQVGGAGRCVEMATLHAQTRVQFGRPIGSFQAIKHLLADDYTGFETAQSTLWYAACVADGQDGSLAEMAPTIKAYASEVFVRCAADAIQVHGGMGFTWECDAHFYLKHARATSNFLGNPVWHREQLARTLRIAA